MQPIFPFYIKCMERSIQYQTSNNEGKFTRNVLHVKLTLYVQRQKSNINLKRHQLKKLLIVNNLNMAINNPFKTEY